MTKKWQWFILLIVTFPVMAQHSVSGRVLNANTKKPLSSASVFLNNTSIGIVCKEDGSFMITGILQDQVTLVISNIGFETMAKTVDLRKIHEMNIELKPESDNLKSLDVVPPDPNGWTKWGSLFTKIFVGTTPYAFNCQITNPEVLKFRVVQNNILIVNASKPILIKNDALGYGIQYSLEEFEFDLASKMVSYNGYAFFTDFAITHPAKSVKWFEKREEVYEGSLMHFMRSYFVNHLQKEGFEMRSLAKISNPKKDRAKYLFNIHRDSILLDTVSIVSDQLTMTSGDGTPVLNPSIKRTVNTRDSSQYYKNALNEQDSIISHSIVSADTVGFMIDSTTAGFYYPDSLEVIYTLKPTRKAYKSFSKHKDEEYPQSQFVFFNKKPIGVLSNGFYFGPHDLRITGYWAWWETVATMLPYDYLPGK